MKKMESKKRAYTTPEMMVYPMQEDNLLQAVSGQHKHIGQGGTYGDAKHSNIEWDEWVDEDNSASAGNNEDNE